MNKQTIKSVIRNLLYRFRQFKNERFYHLVMRKNGIVNKKAIGEKEGIEYKLVNAYDSDIIQHVTACKYLNEYKQTFGSKHCE